MVVSAPPEARVSPSPLNATEETGPVWPWRVVGSLGVWACEGPATTKATRRPGTENRVMGILLRDWSSSSVPSGRPGCPTVSWYPGLGGRVFIPNGDEPERQ